MFTGNVIDHARTAAAATGSITRDSQGAFFHREHKGECVEAYALSFLQ